MPRKWTRLEARKMFDMVPVALTILTCRRNDCYIF